jgi:hypothetical protein
MALNISWTGVFIRIALAVALVLLTYNPTGYSFYHWLTEPPAGITAVKVIAGILLLIGWIMCLRSAFVALGWLGLILGGGLLAACVWLLVDLKIVHMDKASELTWITLIVVGILLGIGLSWSLIRARVTGQVEVQ